MKILRLTIKNFKSYRESQTIEFATDNVKSITILEGQMGHGKSNFLNAFYWCLFDQYWDGDKNELIESPDPNTVYMFNKGATLDLSNEGEHIEMSIQIEFLDDNGNKYIASRSQTGFYSKKKWTFKRHSELNLERRSAADGTSKIYEGEAAINEVEKLFPPSLSNYFLLRGENRTELVKLQGKSKFQEALNELSKVALFKRCVLHLEKIKDELRRELAEDAEEEIKRQIEDALSRKENAIKVNNDYQETLAQLETVEQKKKDEYQYYRDRIKKDRDALELKGKIEIEENQIKQIGKQLDQLFEDQRKQVTRHWGSLLIQDLIEKTQKRYQEAVNSGTYPPDIKSSVIKKILHDLRCICGREVEEGSREYQLIERLKEINSYDHLIGQIEAIASNFDRLNNLLECYPIDIKEQSTKAQGFQAEIHTKNELIENYKKRIGDIDETLEELQNKQDEAHKELINTNNKIKETKELILTKRKELESIEKELTEYEKKIKKSKLPAIKLNLAEKSLREARNLKKQYEKAIYRDLESYTQEHWDLLVYDKLNYDRINLDPDEMYFEIYDKEGNPSRSIMNTGHSILLVLSFISALTRIAREIWKEEYPLVMDAPTSEIGESAMESALNGFTKVFNQAIVILKDGSVAHDLPKKLKEKVGKRYWIEFQKEKQHSSIISKELNHA
ncbi:AAA family ATPase [Croceitalea marina]|uniref:AAA family ATPase n=1 Tax=Croceitalea marina TaxID=1775166 RepID=A0ABW5MS09_9FLAO